MIAPEIQRSFAKHFEIPLNIFGIRLVQKTGACATIPWKFWGIRQLPAGNHCHPRNYFGHLKIFHKKISERQKVSREGCKRRVEQRRKGNRYEERTVEWKSTGWKREKERERERETERDEERKSESHQKMVGSQAASQSVSQPANQPVCQPVYQPVGQPASHSGSQTPSLFLFWFLRFLGFGCLLGSMFFAMFESLEFLRFCLFSESLFPYHKL